MADPIFKDFDPSQIIVDQVAISSSGLWRNGATEWSAFFTSSRQTQKLQSQNKPKGGLYYVDVYDGIPTDAESEICFSLTYGNYNGLGSSDFDKIGSMLNPTKVIYTEYSNALLSPSDVKFTFATSSNFTDHMRVDSDDIYVMNYKNTLVKDGLAMGTFELKLSGDNGVLTLIDDSVDNPNTSVESSGKRFNLIRGSLSGGPVVSGRTEGIGLVYPSIGIVILNPSAIQRFIGNVDGYSLSDPVSQWGGQFESMPMVLFKSITSIESKVVDVIHRRRYVVVADNREFNFTNNPSFSINHNRTREGDPQVYPTTIGLYDTSRNLIAVAKLDEPTRKNFKTRLTSNIILNF